jgi:ABC-type Fe3+ transport system substrate-binding protein
MNKTVTVSDRIAPLVEAYPELTPLFEEHGLDGYLTTESLERIGRFVGLGTLLKSNHIDPQAFVDAANRRLSEALDVERDFDPAKLAELHLMSMLPCGLRNPFVKAVQTHLLENPEIFSGFNYLNEGNLNHELSYYPLVDQIASIDEMPDVMIASDVNHFFHRPFVEKFIETGEFESVIPYEPNDYLKACGFYDPGNHYTMYTANMLVMVVDKARLGDRPMPRVWDDLLDPAFANDVIMRGDGDFFCNAIMLPYYKAHGIGAVRKFARNIKSGMHPSQMVKLAGSGKAEAATVYIMPYFFAKRILSAEVETVWPEDGAIASPVFILAKKGMREKHAPLFSFLFSEEMSNMLARGHFTPIHPAVSTDLPASVSWLGWEFLSKNPIGKIKDEIRAAVDEERCVRA